MKRAAVRLLFGCMLKAALVLALLPAAAGTEGVSQTRVKLGLHVSLTGAAPVPTGSVEKGKDLFFRWLESKGRKINGRYVDVVIRNDQHNPTTATAVCKEMVEEERVFALVGLFYGPDVQRACARYADGVGVPYISPSTTKTGFGSLDTYFGINAPWPRQARLLADYLVEKQAAKDRENGMLRSDSPSYNRTHVAFVAEMSERNASVHYDRAVNNNAGAQEAAIVVSEMKAAGIDNVFVLTAPVFFIQVLKQANSQGFFPRWVGIGPTMTYDTVLSAACPDGVSVQSARFFALVPPVQESDRFDPAFRKAVRKFHPEQQADSYMFEEWGAQKVIAEMLRAAGRRLTRPRFVARVERSDRIRTGVMPPVDFAPADHFGGRKIHLLKADCAARRWRTARAFIGDF